MSSDNFNIQVSSSKPMNFKVVPVYTAKPMYMMIGSSVKATRGIQGYDLLKAVLEFNGDMRWLFKLLIDGLNRDTNCCDISELNLSPSHKVMCSVAYKQLSKIDLVKRIRKGVYMINPRAIIPPKTYPEAQAVWDSKVNKNLIVTSSSEELSHE